MADTGQGYTRPKEGFRFRLGGSKTNVPADALSPTKYALAQNVRAVRDTGLRCRAGLAALAASDLTVPLVLTDIRAYAQLNTNDQPILLGRTAGDSIVMATLAGAQATVGSLTFNNTQGAAMVPFRPAESPTPWMYIANGADYQKFSAPSSAAVVTQQKVGIAEPQTPPDAAIAGSFLIALQSANPSFVLSGTASGGTNVTRTTDVTGAVRTDPGAYFNNLWSIQISSAVQYQKKQDITIGGNTTAVEDVFQPLTTPVKTTGIYYYSGGVLPTGRCVVTPANMTAGPGDAGESVYTQNLLSSLRRGALIEFQSNGEICYVWSVTEGPDGTVCFETSTVATHTAGGTFTILPAIQVVYGGTLTSGLSIVSYTYGFEVTAGLGAATSSAIIPNPFVNLNVSVQPEDYILFQVMVDNLANLNEIKLLFDCGDGSLLENFYYYSVRPSDIAAAVANTLTQLGAAQIVTQRAVIDEEDALAANNQQQTISSAQTSPGSSQWSQIMIPISAFTRVGNDQTKSLMTVDKFQLFVNANATVNVQFGPVCTCGGGQADVGPSGAPYLYRLRPRSSLTGVKGNPSPETRYGVNPRRQQVVVEIPTTVYDPQIDTWDIFRYGGSVTSWRKIGQVSVGAAYFYDNYSDYSALEGEELEFDNLEPWPSVDVPLSASATVVGTTAVVTIPTSAATNVLRFLPGNLVRLGNVNTYTLWNRPVQLTSTTYLFQFMENAGTPAAPTPLFIYEPEIARQFLPYMVGPDASGTVVAMGDPLRPGTASFSKNYQPDAAPDSYNQEIVQPAEPLLGGETIDGLIYLASPKRWWALYPQPDNPVQRYNAIQQPIPRGLAGPYGHCTDGKTLYWWAEDGIWSSAKGSLTDADLYNLFPHEGVPGDNYVYGGVTVYAPDYSKAWSFRLTYCNHYLYATYLDATTARYRCLVLDLERMAWVVDSYPNQVAVFYALEQQVGTFTPLPPTRYPALVAGDNYCNFLQPVDNSNDYLNNLAPFQPIQEIVATMEWDGGDLRVNEQWGDIWLYLTPAANLGVTVQPMSLGAAAAPLTTITASSTAVQTPVSLGGEVLADFMGVMLTWADDFTTQTVATSLEAWQPSFIPKPEIIADRFTDWYDGGTEQAKYVQGFLLHADTGNAVKGLAVRDGDALATHAFTTPVQHNGESIKAYSFATPFIAHTMRLEPTDQQPWRFFDVAWVFEPTPEMAETWAPQGTSFGFNGYSHVQRIVAAYASTTPVTLLITTFDGQDPAPITLPSTGGAYQKLLQVLTPNKGQLYFFSAESSAPFQLYLDDFEIQVGAWGREGAYLTWKSLGASHGVRASV